MRLGLHAPTLTNADKWSFGATVRSRGSIYRRSLAPLNDRPGRRSQRENIVLLGIGVGGGAVAGVVLGGGGGSVLVLVAPPFFALSVSCLVGGSVFALFCFLAAPGRGRGVASGGGALAWLCAPPPRAVSCLLPPSVYSHRVPAGHAGEWFCSQGRQSPRTTGTGVGECPPLRDSLRVCRRRRPVYPLPCPSTPEYSMACP